MSVQLRNNCIILYLKKVYNSQLYFNEYSLKSTYLHDKSKNPHEKNNFFIYSI